MSVVRSLVSLGKRTGQADYRVGVEAVGAARYDQAGSFQADPVFTAAHRSHPFSRASAKPRA